MFLDTNVLVYCVDAHDLARQRTCRRHLRMLRAADRAIISTQVLQEFFAAATRKVGLTADRAREFVSDFRQLPTVTVTADLIDRAIVCHKADRIAFWDALIVVSAAGAGCGAVLSEDLQAGQTIQGVRIVDPSAAGPLID